MIMLTIWHINYATPALGFTKGDFWSKSFWEFIFVTFHIFHIFSSRFPSLGIPRLELENPRRNTYVGHWNSYVGIPMSNVGIPTWVFSFLPRFLPNLMIFQCILYQIQIIKIIKLGKNLGRNEKTHVGIPTLDIGISTLEFQCPT